MWFSTHLILHKKTKQKAESSGTRCAVIFEQLQRPWFVPWVRCFGSQYDYQMSYHFWKFFCCQKRVQYFLQSYGTQVFLLFLETRSMLVCRLSNCPCLEQKCYGRYGTPRCMVSFVVDLECLQLVNTSPYSGEHSWMMTIV